MTLITIRNLGVTLNAPLFSQLNLVINAGDRIGLVAANGRGKSTLLRCIAGIMEPGDGGITAVAVHSPAHGVARARFPRRGTPLNGCATS